MSLSRRLLRKQRPPAGLLMRQAYGSELATSQGLALAAKAALKRGHQAPELVAIVTRRGSRFDAVLATRDHIRAEYARQSIPVPDEIDTSDPPGSLRMLVDYDGHEQSELIDLGDDHGR